MITKLLIADDEAPVLKVMKDFFELKRYEVIMAQNGEEALNKARSEKPALAILDVTMPKLDGFEVCQAMRKDPALAKTPVIMLTAREAIKDKITGKECGADVYLLKPLVLDNLLMNVEALLRGGKGARFS